MSLKEKEKKQPVFKARFVVQGHRDREKAALVHESTNMRQPSIKVLTAIAAIFGFHLWSTDLSQAYLQSGMKLLQDVYITKEFRLSPQILLKLLRPLYGLPDAGDYCHATFKRHMKLDLGMKKTFGCLALFLKHVNNQLIWLAGIYVDDSLLAGTEEFKKINLKTGERFDSSTADLDFFTFSCISITRKPNTVLLQQQKQAQRMRYLPPTAKYWEFRSLIAKFVWLCHTRPEICCYVAQLAQCTDNQIGEQHIRHLNATVRTIRANPNRGILHRKHDRELLRLIAFADGAFANNPELISQLGYLIVLADAHDHYNVLSYRYFKSRRVTHSVLGAEVIAFAEAFDAAFVLKIDLENFLGRHVPLTMPTDSRSLFDVINKNSTTTERRLIIDIAAAR